MDRYLQYAVWFIWIVIGLIGLLTLWGCLRLLACSWGMWKEQGFLRKLSAMLMTGFGSTRFRPETFNALSLATVFSEADHPGMQKSRIFQFVVQQIRLTQTGAFREYAVRDIDLSQYEAHMRAVRFLAGILVFLALLGTVTGLWLALKSLPALSSNGQNFSAFDGMVQHMPLAFLSTMTGIGGTVVLSWGGYRCQVAQTRLQNNLNDLMLDCVIPNLYPAPEKALRLQWDSANKKREDTLSTLKTSNELLTSLGGDYLKPLREDSAAFRSQYDKVLASLMQSATELSNVVLKVKDESAMASARIEMAVRHAEIAMHSSALAVSTRFDEATQKAAMQMEQTASDNAQALQASAYQTGMALEAITQRAAAKVETLGDAVTQTAEKTLGAVTTLQTETSRLIDALTQSTHEISGTLTKVGEAVEAVPGLLAQEHLDQKAYRQTLVDLNQTQAEVREDLKTVLSNWIGLGTQIASLEQQMQQSLQETLRRSEAAAKQSATEHEKFLESLRDASAKLSNQLEDLKAREISLHNAINSRISLVLGSETGAVPTPAERISKELNDLGIELKRMTERIAAHSARLAPVEPPPPEAAPVVSPVTHRALKRKASLDYEAQRPPLPPNATPRHKTIGEDPGNSEEASDAPNR